MAAAFCMSLDNRSVESDTVAAVPNRRYVLTYQPHTEEQLTQGTIRNSYRPAINIPRGIRSQVGSFDSLK
ncbi:uncharacterized, partial [Tachysurus ichikawai]